MTEAQYRILFVAGMTIVWLTQIDWTIVDQILTAFIKKHRRHL